MKKEILGYEGLYSIDNNGVVYSTPSDGKPHKILKQESIYRSNTTYKRVSLSKNGIVKRFQVHRLVAEIFLPNPNKYTVINHIDNDGSNNSVSNLEWCTQKMNIQHSIKQGRHISCDPKACSKATKSYRKNRTEEVKKKYDALVGTTYKNRKLLNMVKYGKHPSGNFLCLQCSKEFTASIADSIKPRYKEALLGCRSCSLKHARRKDIV